MIRSHDQLFIDVIEKTKKKIIKRRKKRRYIIDSSNIDNSNVGSHQSRQKWVEGLMAEVTKTS